MWFRLAAAYYSTTQSRMNLLPDKSHKQAFTIGSAKQSDRDANSKKSLSQAACTLNAIDMISFATHYLHLGSRRTQPQARPSTLYHRIPRKSTTETKTRLPNSIAQIHLSRPVVTAIPIDNTSVGSRVKRNRRLRKNRDWRIEELRVNL